jgi:hypothetical protein
MERERSPGAKYRLRPRGPSWQRRVRLDGHTPSDRARRMPRRDPKWKHVPRGAASTSCIRPREIRGNRLCTSLHFRALGCNGRLPKLWKISCLDSGYGTHNAGVEGSSPSLSTNYIPPPAPLSEEGELLWPAPASPAALLMWKCRVGRIQSYRRGRLTRGAGGKTFRLPAIRPEPEMRS